MKSARWRRVLRGLLISCATLVLLLITAEIVLRLCGYADNPAVYYDPDVGLRYYANQQRHMLNGQRVLGEFRTNEWGFRTPSFALEKAPGVTRIVCLGDSFTLGWGVDDRDTWPRRLQELCDEREGRGRVEVLNLGQPDFNTVNEERLYRSFARRLHADVVILGYVLNDMAPETLAPIDATSRIDRVIGTTAIMRYLRIHFFGRWGVYQPANNPENTRRRAEFGARIGDVLGDPDGETGHSYWEVSMQALDALARETQADGTRLLLLSFPDSGQVRGLHAVYEAADKLDPAELQASAHAQNRLRRECTELGVPMRDLLEDFSRCGPMLYGDIDGSHPAAPGQRIAGEAAHAWLEELQLLGRGTLPR